MNAIYLQLQDAIALLGDKLHNWLNELILLTPNAIIALIIMVSVYVTARYVKKITRNILTRFSVERTINNLVSSIITTVFVLLGFFVALHVLHLDKAVTSLLAGAGLVGLAVGLAFQDPIINTISGILMSFKKPYKAGDMVETNDQIGFIERIDLRNTRLRLLSGELVVMPNKMVIQSPLKNFTYLGSRRVEVKCGVSYSDDLEEVNRLAVKAIENNVDYDTTKPVEFYYEEFGGSSINFTLRFWIDLYKQPDFLKARSEAIVAIKKAFDKTGVTIPFPIRTLDFGDKEKAAIAQIASKSFYKATNASKPKMVTSDN